MNKTVIALIAMLSFSTISYASEVCLVVTGLNEQYLSCNGVDTTKKGSVTEVLTDKVENGFEIKGTSSHIVNGFSTMVFTLVKP